MCVWCCVSVSIMQKKQSMFANLTCKTNKVSYLVTPLNIGWTAKQTIDNTTKTSNIIHDNDLITELFIMYCKISNSENDVIILSKFLIVWNIVIVVVELISDAADWLNRLYHDDIVY